MMRKNLLWGAAVLMILTTLGGGCLPGPGSADALKYKGATEETVAIGETLPGSNIRYVGFSEDGAELLIDDQRAVKKVGDSLDWQGKPAPGVEVAVTQRILLANETRLQTVGAIKLTVQDPFPAVAQFPDKPASSYKVAVTYTVKRGATIPGTLITYTGKTDSGAELKGVSGYPYRKIGDSIGWTGRLRANVYLDMTARVIAYTDDFIQVAGLATVGVTGE